jgi:carbon monoxide dehydrogenase subunit G
MGTELTSVVNVRSLRNRITWRVGAYEPPRSLTISGHGVGGLHVALALTIRRTGDHTTVAVHAEITGKPTAGLRSG